MLANNQTLAKRANEMFGSELAAAEKRRNELEAELHQANMECIDLEEKIRYCYTRPDGASKHRLKTEIIFLFCI